MKSGKVRARRQEMGSMTPSRQTRDEAFGMQMGMRAHGQLMTYAVKMMLMMLVLSLMPASLSPIVRSRRKKRKEKEDKMSSDAEIGNLIVQAEQDSGMYVSPSFPPPN